ncbi:hypothetical protein ID866_4067 [Astraeus odoratus]|nr:hypothetical protein ID866_4067 [Astraeus odoratus]
MPKRSRTRVDSDSDAFSEHVSQESDSSFLELPKSRKPSNKANKSRKTRKVASNGEKEAALQVQSTVAPLHPASMHVVSSSDVLEIRDSLLAWYDQVHDARGMPWRKRYDPSLGRDGRAQRAYEVWISEIMLQQTQVATVIPYYNRWMARFPSIKDLASSDIETVNSLWKGLGYYSRAARLLTAAQKVVKELGGRLPDNAKDMQAKIPGLDGNVHRLLSRFLALYAPPKGKQALDILWEGAEAFVKNSSRAGDINQALIELGSTVCKVRDPTCSDCALRSWCQAYKQSQRVPKNQEIESGPDIEELCTLCEPLPVDEEAGLVTIYPMKVERKKAREELDSVNVIEWRAQDSKKRFFILVRRPEGGAIRVVGLAGKADMLSGLLAGLHEFPTVPSISGAPAVSGGAPEIVDKLLAGLLVNPPPPFRTDSHTQRVEPDMNNEGLRIDTIRPVGDVVHVFSHIRKTYRVQWVVLEGGGDEPPTLLDESCASSLPIHGKAAGNGKEKRIKIPEKSKGYSSSSQPRGATRSRWVPLEEVESAK